MPAAKRPRYTLLDATLALVLAARIHKSGAAVRATAKSLAPNTDKHTRLILRMVCDSRSPLDLLDRYLEELTDE